MASLTGSATSVEFIGLREVSADLKRMGVPDAEVKTAMNSVGQIVVDEARTLMPTTRSGKLSRSLKANKNRNTIKVTVGNNTTVKYAYTFHAMLLGKSRGGFTYHVPASSRKGRPVRGYTRLAYIPDNPFLHKAAVNKRDSIFDAYKAAMLRLIQGVSSG